MFAGIIINNHENKCTSGNITTSTSDHLPQFLVIENFEGKIDKIKATLKQLSKITKILITNLFRKIFKEFNRSLAIKNDDVKLEFETFFKIFTRTLNKHAPYKEIR